MSTNDKKNPMAHPHRMTHKRPVIRLLATALCLGGTAQAAEETRTTVYVYDASGQVVREIVEPFTTRLCAATEYTYDGYGNRSTAQPRNCNGTAIPGVGNEAAAPAATDLASFSMGGLSQRYDYPGAAGATARTITSTNVLGHQNVETLDPRFGTTLSVTDANGLITKVRYDGLGRKTLEQHPDGNGTRWIYQACGGAVVCPGVWNLNVDLVTPRYVITSYAVSGANVDTDAGTKDGPHTKTYHDVLDRVLRVEREGWDGEGTARLIYEDTAYNGRGKLHKKSAPYFAGDEVPWASFSIDVMDRVEYQTQPHPADSFNGTTTISYIGLQTTQAVQVLNAATANSTQTAQTRTETRNAVGQVVSVTDSENHVQTRTYTPWGDLRTTVDPAGNTVRMEYDLLGRKTKLVDPDLGTWTYDYDALGRLVRQTDARSQASQLEYDPLGRLKRRLEPDQESRWSYDSQYADGSACANAKGRLCEARTLTGTGATDLSRRLAYDSLGRVIRTITNASVAGGIGSYQAEVSYNARGQVLTQTYPGPGTSADPRLGLTLAYTPLGYLKSVSDSASGQAYWSATRYDAQQHLTLQSYRNSVTTTRSYDVMGRLLTSAAGSGNAVQNDSYGYDFMGNLRSRGETRAGAILTYQYDYDNLNRLKSEARSGGAVTGTQSIAWNYDTIGNITSRSDVGTYAYPPAGGPRPHAVSSVTGTVNGVANPGYSYDANGNITVSAGRTVSWMSFNLPASIMRGSNELAWAYDSEHQRVREQLKVNGTATRTTVYMNPGEGEGLYYEEEIANGVLKRRHYIAGAEGTVAVLTRQAGVADQVRYWHKDHLGSTQVVTDESGAVVERLAYEPFGKRRNADGTTDAAGTLTPISTDRGFTGHEMLDDVGLIHMNGRIYDAAIGRFLSADPNVPYPLDLQSYNRYSYARNNPLSLVDPSGFEDGYYDTGYGCSFGTTSYGYSYDAPSTYNWAGSGVGTLGGATYGSGLSMYYDPLGIKSSGGLNITAAPVVAMTGSEDLLSTIGRGAGAAKESGAIEIAGQGFRATRDLLDGGYGTKTQEAFDRGDVAGVVGNTGAGAAYAAMNLVGMGVGTVAKLGTSLVSKGVVALDTNALIAATQEGKAAEVLAAIAARTPVVSRTAVREFLAGGNSVAVLREYLASIGGRIAAAGTEAEAAALRAQATQMGRSLGVNDSRVGASAAREGAETITNDKRFRNFLNAVGLGGLGF